LDIQKNENIYKMVCIKLKWKWRKSQIWESLNK